MKFKIGKWEITMKIREVKEKKHVPIPRPPKIEVDENRLLHLKDAGKSNREIAEIFGVSEKTIRNRLSE